MTLEEALQIINDPSRTHITLVCLEYTHLTFEKAARKNRLPTVYGYRYKYHELIDAILANTNITGLGFDSGSIDYDYCVYLAKALETATNLQRLVIANATIGVRGGIAIAKAFRLNQSIRHMELHNGLMSHEGLIAFAEALRFNKTLKSLTIIDNYDDGPYATCEEDPSIEALGELHRALKSNTTLTELKVSFDPDELIRLGIAFETNPDLADTKKRVEIYRMIQKQLVRNRVINFFQQSVSQIKTLLAAIEIDPLAVKEEFDKATDYLNTLTEEQLPKGFYAELKKQFDEIVVMIHCVNEDYQNALLYYLDHQPPIDKDVVFKLVNWVWCNCAPESDTEDALAESTFRFASKQAHIHALFALMRLNFIDQDIQTLIAKVVHSAFEVNTMGSYQATNATLLGVTKVVPLSFIRQALRECEPTPVNLDELFEKLGEMPPAALNELCQQSPLKQRLQAVFDEDDATFTTFELLITHQSDYPVPAIVSADTQEDIPEDFNAVVRRILDKLPITGEVVLTCALRQLRDKLAPASEGNASATSVAATRRYSVFSALNPTTETTGSEPQSKRARSESNASSCP